MYPKIYEMVFEAIQEYTQFYNIKQFNEKIHGLVLIFYWDKAVA